MHAGEVLVIGPSEPFTPRTESDFAMHGRLPEPSLAGAAQRGTRPQNRGSSAGQPPRP
jgi:hypothetical protein